MTHRRRRRGGEEQSGAHRPLTRIGEQDSWGAPGTSLHRAAAGKPLSASEKLQLQRTVGNRALVQLMAAAERPRLVRIIAGLVNRQIRRRPLRRLAINVC